VTHNLHICLSIKYIHIYMILYINKKKVHMYTMEVIGKPFL